ncbi:hypothetical protein LJY25_03550 [Hymenobacter sp. BT175]|uniref:hypothetical protein n=1 Tax=Hymenobacter translucens TaxID=2886507 RepID=UPI001D0ECE10|nr:hypothetical protein [Hymenobacter translucens]MCC2545506.1 hypothetical protein [Hymenobacter translucens]
MEPSSFFRVELNDEQVAVEDDELAALRKDILLYFDTNLDEPVSIYMPADQFTLPYWKYLSLGFSQQWAESVHYQRLVEEGCLALLNGIALDLLDEPIGIITKHWRQEPVVTLLQYVEHYQPSSAKLATARTHLIRTLSFILNLTESDLDPIDRCLRTGDHIPGAKWITEEIIRAYYHWRLTINKGP